MASAKTVEGGGGPCLPLRTPAKTNRRGSSPTTTRGSHISDDFQDVTGSIGGAGGESLLNSTGISVITSPTLRNSTFCRLGTEGDLFCNSLLFSTTKNMMSAFTLLEIPFLRTQSVNFRTVRYIKTSRTFERLASVDARTIARREEIVKLVHKRQFS